MKLSVSIGILFSLGAASQAQAMGSSSGGSGSYQAPNSSERLKSLSPQPPKAPSCVRNVSSTIQVRGTFDGSGCLYRWRGRGYPKDCGALREISENQPKMFIVRKGGKLRNLQIECSLDGVQLDDNSTIENVLFRDVEEDMVNLSGSENVTIRNVTGFFHQDKAVQINSANNVNIDGMKLYHGQTGITGSPEGSSAKGTVKNSKFYNLKTAIRARGKFTWTVSNTTIENADCAFVEQSGGKVIKGSSVVLKNVKRERCSE
jgi:hypothetical protein